MFIVSELTDHLLEILVLGQREELFVELSKHLFDGSLSLIVFVGLHNVDYSVYYLHDELSIVFMLEIDGLVLNSKIFDFLGLQIVANFDFIAKDKIVTLVISAIDLVDNVVHSGSASCDGCLGVVISQIDENGVDNGLDLSDEVEFEFVDFEFRVEVGSGLKAFADFGVDGVDV